MPEPIGQSVNPEFFRHSGRVAPAKEPGAVVSDEPDVDHGDGEDDLSDCDPGIHAAIGGVSGVSAEGLDSMPRGRTTLGVRRADGSDNQGVSVQRLPGSLVHESNERSGEHAGNPNGEQEG